MPFSTLPAAFARALAERGYTNPTPVQAAVLGTEADERDLLVSAQTGSGKTVAYGLAMAASLLEDGALPRADGPLALIIAPTRELALQVETELNWLYAEAGARVVACVGGMDPIRERRQLERGVHIVVGTPGRLRDHAERRALRLDALKVVVLDEADEMLDLGFREDIEFLLQATPAERRTFLFSATLPKAIITLARNYQQDAFRIEMAATPGGHADIEYRAIRVAHAKADRAVTNLLRLIDPACALVFCATRMGVQRMYETLAGRGFDVVALSGEMNQAERNRALTSLREGRAKVCVATDVAARGLDVPDLSLVIHAELPNDAEILQHRSGRTGRAGKKGISILLVPPSRRRSAEEMLSRAKVQYTWTDPPTPHEIYTQDRERLLTSPLFNEAGPNEDTDIAEVLAERMTPLQLAIALSRLHRSQLPTPENLDEYVEDTRSRRAKDSDRDGAPPRREKYAGKKENSGYEARPERAPSDKPAWEPRERKAYEKKGPRPERGPRPEAGHSLDAGAVWFRISVGRERNADPKWLLPEICRQGEVTKKEIGEIRVFDTETRFQLDASVAEEFAAKVALRTKGGVAIYPAFGGEPGDSPMPEEPRGEAPNMESPRPRADRPHTDRNHRPQSGGWSADAPRPPRPEKSEYKPRPEKSEYKPRETTERAPTERKGYVARAEPTERNGYVPRPPGSSKPTGGKPYKGKKDFKPGYKPDFKAKGKTGYDPKAAPTNYGDPTKRIAKGPKVDAAPIRALTPPDPDRKAKRKERKKEKRKLAALKS